MSDKLFCADDTPTQVQWRLREARPEGWQVVDTADLNLAVNKLRLAGVYDDRQERWFMLRTRIAGGILTADQAEVIADVAREFSERPDGDTDPDHFVEITTRQNIQLHWLLFEKLPELWDRYDAVGLTSLSACGSSLRNVTSCAVAGLRADEWLDARPAVAAVTRLALEDQEFSAFLPRKFKVAVSGCRTDCVIARVNCLAFVPARLGGMTGYAVLAGGGLSDYPRLASDLDIFVEPVQVEAVVRAALGLYRDEGDYEHPAVNRFRMLVHQLGDDRVAAGIRERLDFVPGSGAEQLSDGTWDDHLGVHADRFGTHFVGLNVPVGRLQAEELSEVARLARTYGDGEIRLTQRQDLILTGVHDVAGLLAEPLLERLSPEPDPFARGIVSCTSAPFCKFGILNVKRYGTELAASLRERVPREHWERLQGIRIHLSGCKASCAQPQLAHIGMRSTMGKDEATYHDSFDLTLDGTNLRLGRWADLEVPAGAAFERTAELLVELARSRNGEGLSEAAARVLGGVADGDQ